MSDIERVFITRENKPHNWPLVIDAIKKWVDQGVRVTVEPKQEDRKLIQNRLAKLWCAQAAKHHGHHPDYIWGAWKWDHLRGLKLGDEKQHERAQREVCLIEGAASVCMGTDLFDGEGEREIKIEAAFDVMRSKKIGVRLFAEWLTLIQSVEANNGLILTARKPDLERALMRMADEREAA